MVKEIVVRIKPPRKHRMEPYSQYVDHRAWNVLDKAIEDLVENQDLVETTMRKYIVGYLIKRLTEQDLLINDTKNKEKKVHK